MTSAQPKQTMSVCSCRTVALWANNCPKCFPESQISTASLCGEVFNIRCAMQTNSMCAMGNLFKKSISSHNL